MPTFVIYRENEIYYSLNCFDLCSTADWIDITDSEGRKISGKWSKSDNLLVLPSVISNWETIHV